MKKVFALLLAAMFLIVLCPVALADGTVEVTYINGAGEKKTVSATPVTGAMTGVWSSGWYVVNSDVTMTDAAVTVNGLVRLILADGCTLEIVGASGKAGINVAGTGNSLNVYGQEAGTGTLIARGTNEAAGIGTNQTQGAAVTVSIYGGNVKAYGAESTSPANAGGAGIGDGVFSQQPNTINIRGGSVYAKGGLYAAGIGGAVSSTSANYIKISGGTVTAEGGAHAAGIGSAWNGSKSCSVTISGGTVKATGGTSGCGIGKGDGASDAEVIIYTASAVKQGSSMENLTDVANYWQDLGTAITGNCVTVEPRTAVCAVELSKRSFLCTSVAHALGAIEADTNKEGSITLKTDVTESVTVPAGTCVHLELDGFTLTGKSGSVITNNGGLYINSEHPDRGGIITGGAGTDGGAIYNDANLVICGGTLSGNNVSGKGGAVYNLGTLEMTGGTVSSNQASEGGGIYNDGALTVTAGEITGNAAYTGGGIFSASMAGLTLGGDIEITDNVKTSGAASNLYLETGSIATLDAPGNMHVGITTETAPDTAAPVTFTSVFDTDPAGFFTPDESGYVVLGIRDGSGYTAGLAIIPEAPEVDFDASAVTDTSVILPANEMWEYSTDGENWSASPEFNGLTSETEYTFYVRIAATETAPSSKNAVGTVWTAKAAPSAEESETALTFDYKAETVSFDETLYEVENSEEELLTSGGIVTPGETLLVCVKGSPDAAPSSEGTPVTVPVRPAAPDAVSLEDVTRKDTSFIVFHTDTTLEYSIDEGTTWTAGKDDAIAFKGLSPRESVKLICRVRATTSEFASETSAALSFTTKSEPLAAEEIPEALVPTVEAEKTSATVLGDPLMEYVFSIEPCLPVTIPEISVWDLSESVDQNGAFILEDLSSNTEYYLFYRMAETDDSMASEVGMVAFYTIAETPDVSKISSFEAGNAQADAVLLIGEGEEKLTKSNFVSVFVDGKALTEKDYSVEDGCIRLTLSKSFLNSLKAGKHTVEVALRNEGYEGMTVSTSFVVEASKEGETSDVPKSGDTTYFTEWFILAVLSLAVMGFTLRRKKA